LKTTNAAFFMDQTVVVFSKLLSHVISESSSLTKYKLTSVKGGALYGITWPFEFLLSTSLRHGGLDIGWVEKSAMLFKTKSRVLQ